MDSFRFALEKYFYRILNKNFVMLPFSPYILISFVFSSSSVLFHLFINNKFYSVYLNNIRLIQLNFRKSSASRIRVYHNSAIALKNFPLHHHNILSVRQALLNNNNNFVYDMQIVCMQIFSTTLTRSLLY